MSTLVKQSIGLTHLVTHRVGNKSREEGIRLSESGSRIKQEALEPLVEYLLHPFKPEVFYNLASDADLGENEVLAIVKRIFTSQDSFVDDSKKLAELLYEASEHPNVKEGYLHIARMQEAVLDGEIVDVIGLFKTETAVPFLLMDPVEGSMSIAQKEGYSIKGLDKGALIFQTDEEKGYRVLTHSSDRGGAAFWNDAFLRLKDAVDDFHITKEFMTITKEFVTDHMPAEFEVDKTERIDLLNRSVEYFKENESFNKQDFAETVFQDENVIKSFDAFDDTYREERSLAPVEQFDISTQAVKKQAKVFKSVLKLDKNFHVYIHGDKNLIEKGKEEDGRKFYKIYYSEEK